MAFLDNGTIKGIDFTDVGTALITFRPNRRGDLKGHGIITTTSTGKAGSDSSNQVDKAGNDVTIGWEWK